VRSSSPDLPHTQDIHPAQHLPHTQDVPPLRHDEASEAHNDYPAPDGYASQAALPPSAHAYATHHPHNRSPHVSAATEQHTGASASQHVTSDSGKLGSSITTAAPATSNIAAVVTLPSQPHATQPPLRTRCELHSLELLAFKCATAVTPCTACSSACEFHLSDQLCAAGKLGTMLRKYIATTCWGTFLLFNVRRQR
jgi:hypothetical protein